MTGDVVYLKPEVKLEALVSRWYAWPHLTAPVQFALHMAFRMLPLLKSFATNPSVHLSASRDPKMYGGPFMSLQESDLPAVCELIDTCEKECEQLIRLAHELRALNVTLAEKSGGYSLNDMYEMLPPSLKGLVEFLYDTDNKACARVFEQLVYDTYDVGHTHEIMLQPIGERERHFFMSTPRPRSPGSLSFKMKFSDPRIDALAKMRTQADSLQKLEQLFDIADDDLPTFRSYFSEAAPLDSKMGAYAGDGVRMRFFGHACVLIQTEDIAVLFDPFVAIESGEDGRLTINDLPDFIDYVVLTHAHQDHFNAEMLLQLRHRIGRVVVPMNNIGSVTDPSVRLMLKELGFNDVDTLSPFDSIALPNGSLLSLPFTGEHADLNIYSKHTVFLSLKGRKFLFLVDSDGRDTALYERLLPYVGAVDALFIGMECHGAPLTWLYEPLLNKPLTRRNNESRRLSGADCERAWRIVSTLKPARVYVYAMGQEPWMQYIMGLQYEPTSIQLVESTRFIERCSETGLVAERLVSGREDVF